MMILKTVGVFGFAWLLAYAGCERSEPRELPTLACSDLEGSRLDLEARCLHPREFAGCAAEPCGDQALRLAMARDGSTWLLYEACELPGWEIIEHPGEELWDVATWPHCGAEAPSEGCSGESGEACGEGEGCLPITGQRYDGGAGCFLDAEVVGCRDGSCGDDAITWAIDSNGDVWRFPDRCVPAEWHELEEPPASVPSASLAANCE